jgi:hypothetical protein
MHSLNTLKKNNRLPLSLKNWHGFPAKREICIMKMKIVIVSLLSICTICFFACKKDASSSQLKVRMTDAPGEWDAVNIDLKEVQVKLNTDSTKWITLQTNTGIYDLLGLQNGIDSLIAEGTFSTAETVKEIRLIVGSENSITVNGQTYALTIPSGAETGLKIKINKKLNATIETVLIDFDAALSIRQEVDGFKLQPVIKLR